NRLGVFDLEQCAEGDGVAPEIGIGGLVPDDAVECVRGLDDVHRVHLYDCGHGEIRVRHRLTDVRQGLRAILYRVHRLHRDELIAAASDRDAICQGGDLCGGAIGDTPCGPQPGRQATPI